MDSGFTILDHPADLGIRAVGSTLEQVFERAAEGLMSVIIDPASVACTEKRRVRLEGSGHEQLLVKWLSEVLYLYDGEEFVGKEVTLANLTSSALSGGIAGEKFSPERHR